MENATENLGQTAADRINAARAPMADALESTAYTVRQHANAGGANLEEYTRKTAEVLGTTAGYLRTHDARQMICDAEETARKNPVQALAAAAAVGFLIGAFLRR
jgi:ElaB/YqjD/DUF883 family membrane-anchored ribosome-binding protein